MPILDDTASPSTPDPTGHLLGLLTRGRPSRFKSLAAWGLAGAGFATQARSRWQTWQSNRSYSVTVLDLDDIYTDVQRWLLDRIPPDKRRGLLASTQRSPYSAGDHAYAEPVGLSSRRDGRDVHLSYDGARTQRVTIDGHALTVSVERRQYNSTGNESVWGEPGRITFTARDRAGRDAAVAFLQQVADDHEASKQGAQLFVATKWGDWQRVREIPPRPLDSVVLAAGQREAMVDDLARFIADEDIYTRLGIPWHRGLLLHGPPGTGKTSIAKALAGHLGLDLFYLPVSDMKADTDLAAMFARVEPRSMLLLEDIDVVHAAKTRDDSGPGVSLSGLLNALDGVVSAHGQIVCMTTNDISVLDSALTRPGRADRTYLVDYLDDDQLHRLVESITGAPVPADRLPSVTGKQVAPAQIVEMLKPHLRANADEAVALVAIELSEMVDA